MNHSPWVTLLAVMLFAGCANPVKMGADAFERGEFDKAAAYWNPLAKAGNPYAEYNLGLLWEDGLGSTPRNPAEASQWYFRSAKQGYVPAMVRLANIQRQMGHDEAALSWLVLAARWGNNDAITALAAWNKSIPPADLHAQA